MIAMLDMLLVATTMLLQTETFRDNTCWRSEQPYPASWVALQVDRDEYVCTDPRRDRRAAPRTFQRSQFDPASTGRLQGTDAGEVYYCLDESAADCYYADGRRRTVVASAGGESSRIGPASRTDRATPANRPRSPSSSPRNPPNPSSTVPYRLGDPVELIRTIDGQVEYQERGQFLTRCGPSISVPGSYSLEDVPDAPAEFPTARLIAIGLQYSDSFDDISAAVCMMKASRRGDPEAMFYLANLYGGSRLNNHEAKLNWLSIALVRARQVGNASIERQVEAELAYEQPAARAARQRRAEQMMGWLAPRPSPQPHPHEVRCMMNPGGSGC